MDVYGNTNRWAHQQKWCNDKADLKNIDPMVTLKHVVCNLNVRPDSSLWHTRDISVLLGSCAKQGQGVKLGHDGMWKVPRIQVSSWGNNITWSSWGIKIRHPLWPICWTGKQLQLYLHEGSKLATLSEQYVDCGISTPGKRPGCSVHVFWFQLLIYTR